MRSEDALLRRDEEAVMSEEAECRADADDDDDDSSGEAKKRASTSAANPRSRLTGDDERRGRRGCCRVMQKMEEEGKGRGIIIADAEQSRLTWHDKSELGAAINGGGAARRPGAGSQLGRPRWQPSAGQIYSGRWAALQVLRRSFYSA